MPRTPSAGKIPFHNILLPLPLDRIHSVSVGYTGRRAHLEFRSAEVPPRRFRVFRGVINRQHADRLVRELRQRIAIGRLEPPAIRLSRFKDQFLDHIKPPFRRYKTWLKYRAALQNLLDDVGDRPLQTITRGDLIQHQSWLLRTGRSGRTANNQLRELRAVFNHAIDLGYLEENPATRIPPATESPTAKPVLSPKEARVLLDKADPWLRDILLFILHTGLRLIEVCKLEWSWINVKRGTLEIRYQKSSQRKTAGFVVVPLDAVSRGILDRCRTKSTAHVFSYPSGAPLNQHLLRYVKQAGKKAGRPDVTIHSLRRSFATWLDEAGVSMSVIQSLLGHTDVNVTQAYTRAMRPAQLTALNLIGQLLDNPEEENRD